MVLPNTNKVQKLGERGTETHGSQSDSNPCLPLVYAQEGIGLLLARESQELGLQVPVGHEGGKIRPLIATWLKPTQTDPLKNGG